MPRRCIDSWANFLCIKPVLITQPLRSWKFWSGSSNWMALTEGKFSSSFPRVLWIYSVTGEWVYPLFALFNPLGLAAFFAGSLAIIVAFYNFGEFLNRMIWGQSKFSSLLLCIWKKYPWNELLWLPKQAGRGRGHEYTGEGVGMVALGCQIVIIVTHPRANKQRTDWSKQQRLDQLPLIWVKKHL